MKNLQKSNVVIQKVHYFFPSQKLGIHWIELHTSNNRSILLGNNKKTHEKSIMQSYDIKHNEGIRFISGGLTRNTFLLYKKIVKTYSFTYVAFHVDKNEDDKQIVEELNKNESQAKISQPNDDEY